MESLDPTIPSPFHLTDDKWNIYYHLPHDSDWSISGYKIIMSEINNLEQIQSLTHNINENIVKNCMLFVMRHNVLPIWEDQFNKNGGCFSYKVANKFVYGVWNDLFKSLCGESLSDTTTISKNINGITISPKKSFCIIKIWFASIDYQDPSVIIDITNLNANGCLFKKHEPEH
jgi:hypothetical protein